jgi:TRAP-type C4-dicarboxylate transport system permease small subunit
VRRWLERLHRLEDLLLAAMLLALIVLSALQIVLRIGFDSGLVWAEAISRMGVLWVALLGALGATRQRQHIMIDAVPRLLPPRGRQVLWTFTQLAAAGVAGLLAWYGIGLVALERESPVPFVAGIPSWVPMLALPLGFGLMSLRFIIASTLAPPTPGELHP